MGIENEEIVFIDSDHRVYPNEDGDFRNEAQFIQFMDLILGSIYCCLHNPTKKKEKREIGLAMKPLLLRMLNNPKNKNSEYHYYGKQQVFFFPKTKASNLNEYYQQLDLLGDWTHQKDFIRNFYTRRPILLVSEEQKTLDEFVLSS